MADVLLEWSEGRSLRFKGKLREVGEDLTARVILGAEQWIADKVDRRTDAKCHKCGKNVTKKTILMRIKADFSALTLCYLMPG